MAPSATPRPARVGSTGGRDVGAWLRTPQGKLTAGAGAAAVVVALALRQRRPAAPAGAIVPAAWPPGGGGGGASGGDITTTPPAASAPVDVGSRWSRLRYALSSSPPTVTATRAPRTISVAWDAIPGAAAVARIGGTAPPAPAPAPIGAGATLARITASGLRRLTAGAS